MSTLIIVLVILLVIGGGFLGHRSYGAAGLGGGLGVALTVLLVLWLLGALGTGPISV